MGYEKLTDEAIRRIRAYYYGNISLIDEWIGRILGALEENGLREDTVVLLTADHGDLLGDHGLLWKCEHAMYDPSVRVPFIVSGGGFSGGLVRNEFVQSVDIFPTFLELGGLDVPYQIQGRSLLDLLNGDSKGWRDAAFSEGRGLQTKEEVVEGQMDLSVVMIRTGRWKYIFFREDEDLCELYDLDNDPNELKNLAGCGEYVKLTAELRERILLWRFDSQRPLHGQVCKTFKEQMSRPATTGRGDKDITWAKP